jgi:ferredoxin
MWGRVLAVSGGPIIVIFTVALWYSDHQKNMSIISNWQKDYNSLLTDKGNVNIRNVQLIRQNRQLVANNGILTEEKQQLSDSLTDLYQKIDTLSVQIDQLQQANELADITSSDLEKQRKINKNLLDESARLSQELEALRTTLSSVGAISIYENDCTGVALCSAICPLEGGERAIGGSCRVVAEEQRAFAFPPVARSYALRQSGKLTNEYTWTCDGNQLASALVMCRKVDNQ